MMGQILKIFKKIQMWSVNKTVSWPKKTIQNLCIWYDRVYFRILQLLAAHYFSNFVKNSMVVIVKEWQQLSY